MSLEQDFEQYSGWRQTLSGGIADFQKWLKDQELADAQVEQRLTQVLSTLRDDKLYIAFVAEFSRGKSELINAIFFAQLGSRVLPSSAGRTTMCPTELLSDTTRPPELRLLPIETRKTGTTIAEFRTFPDEWHTIALDIKSADAVAAALQHITEVKEVERDVAQSLGLHVAEDDSQAGVRKTESGKVEIPKWRHAIINMPHPLLDGGLVILDTPGLNALGSEPELTLNLLPSAHAVLFILAADAGVTKTDIQVWHDHIAGSKEANGKGRLVVLNKIDGLWDELRDWAEVNREIDRQIRETAKTLDIPETSVFPVSAQKALLGKIKKDEKIIERSRIRQLEQALATEILPAKRDIVSDAIEGDMKFVIESMRQLLKQRLDGVHEHLAELQGLNGKNFDVIDHMMTKVKEDKDIFEKSLQRFQATRSIFSQQTNVLYSHLNIKNIDGIIAQTKRDMDISMTTAGLKACMENFFVQSHKTMEAAAVQASEIKEMMEGVYHKFQEEYGLANVKPSAFSVTRYLREIKRLEAKHEQFVKGMSLVFTEQQVLTRKFFESSVAKVRAIYRMANRDADAWLKTIMSPMESQVREHQILLRRRLESIKRIHKATDTLEDRIKELDHIREGIHEQERALEKRVGSILQMLQTQSLEAPVSRTA